MKYLSDNFKMSMIPVEDIKLRIRNVKISDIPRDVESIIDMPAIASDISKLLGWKVPYGFKKYVMKPEDVVYVIRYVYNGNAAEIVISEITAEAE